MQDRGKHNGGGYKKQWVIHREPRDRRVVYFQDPDTHKWHELRWTGLPPEGEMPAFGDARVEELLTRVREAGLKPRSDSYLVPILLEMLGAVDPVENWPSQLTKSQRVQHARETTQARAATADRPQQPPKPDESLRLTAVGAPDTEPLWRERAREATDSLDAHRRRRREAATSSRTPSAPAPLGSSRSRRNLFVIADDDDDPDDAAPPPPSPGRQPTEET